MHERTCLPHVNRWRWQHMLLLTSFLLTGCTSPAFAGQKIEITTGQNDITAGIVEESGGQTTSYNRLHVIKTPGSIGLYSETASVVNGEVVSQTMNTLYHLAWPK